MSDYPKRRRKLVTGRKAYCILGIVLLKERRSKCILYFKPCSWRAVKGDDDDDERILGSKESERQ